MAELLNRVNWVDIFALILLLRISYASSRIGVGKQIPPFILLVLILVVMLHKYADMADFFISRTYFMPSICKFASFSSLGIALFIVYKVVSRVMGCAFLPGENGTGSIEQTGGIIVGLMRGFIIIGMILIGLLLVPVQAVESSVKDSYSGLFFIDANLRVYSTVLDLALKKKDRIYQDKMSELFSKKEGYLFQPSEIKEKSKFFRRYEEY